MTTPENQAEAQGGQVEQELSVLDSLLNKVDLAAPSEPHSKKSTVENEDAGMRLATAVNHLISELTAQGQKLDKLDKPMIESVISGIDQKLSEQVSEVLHNEKFQELESAWRGLKYLVDRTNFRANIKVEVLNCSKEDLRSDLEDAPELLQSGLFHHIYKQEYDQAGGQPIGSVIGNYFFDQSSKDVAMMKNLSHVAAGCHAPFIAAANDKMFGLNSATDLHKVKDMEELFEQQEYTKWRSFRDSEDSRYLGLTYPKFLLREPYNPGNHTMRDFEFHENVAGEDHDKFLWGNASIAFASRLTQSFANNGWCVNIRGPQAGGMVEDLPIFHYEDQGEMKSKIPTEVAISDRVELELAESGFMPLTFYKNSDYACFFSAQSSQKPKKYTTPEATANAKLAANLPYLFLASRLSHYLKVIQRENIGSAKEKDDLQKELDEWIQRLVTKMPNPDPDLKARRPLKDAKIIVSDIEESPGWYSVEMFIRPHFQMEGMSVDMSLVSKMPSGKES
ncbi:type VI secretion system contractile sheath large subunit [Sulfidibacter corallicola]|uniref:Type VI secretion system contractile sheath large subunit n=1 Tax=Sulfidibacter corallicola TaxID=2818388 RepID=A0A8A4TTU3_SULCO|nr:type VI secretion system contractile sheath large subunit [Sulfidibacter corallicola]QTD53379.1 type VI secretion system contractile sheath large subunit [Sulfidibacter corallicola]